MKIQVGDPAINWLALQPQTNHKEVLLVAGDSVRPVGTTHEEIALTEVASRPALRRTQWLKSGVFGDRKTQMILRLLPLTADYQAQIPVYHAVRQAQMMVTLHVFGWEEVTDARGSLAAWKVRTAWGHATQEYWLGIENRELVKQAAKIDESSSVEFVRI
jgi:hypothetical protein